MHWIRRAAAWTAMVLVALICLKAESKQPPEKEALATDPISVCKDAILANRNAIKTIKCRFQLTTDEKERPLMKNLSPNASALPDREIIYWDDGTSMRISIKGLKNDEREEIAWYNKEFKAYRIDGDINHDYGVVSKKNDETMTVLNSPWLYCQFGYQENLPVIFSRKSQGLTSRFEEVAGRRMLVVSSRNEQKQLQTVWFDPKLNYLPIKSVLEVKAGVKWLYGASEVTKETVEHSSLKGGIVFPIKSKNRLTVLGKQLPETLFTVLEIKVNEKIPESVFILEIPEGMRVIDMDKKEAERNERKGKK